MKDNHVERVDKIVSWLKKRIKVSPSVGLIMGSGLSDSVPELENCAGIDYSEIPGFPKSGVQGHKGRLLVGSYKGVGVAAMQGRFHYYEGHPIGDLAVPVRVLAKLGVQSLVVTAAVGSMRPKIRPGDFVFLKDHINFMGRNPLRGNYDSSFGEMFPDMSYPYDPKLRSAALSACRSLKIRCHEGVYIAGTGPSYETPAEIKAFTLLGADVVGMSTVPEVIAARQLKMRVLGASWISNMASGIAGKPLSHEEVLQEGKRAAQRLKKLLEKLLSSGGFK